jgi:hypothetical protein
MEFSKKTMMGVVSLAAIATLAVVAGMSASDDAAAVQANQTGLTLTLNGNNGLGSGDTNSSSTYTWDTVTSGDYHTSWSATGVTYASGYFLHIALTDGEFHNTVTLHQITAVAAAGHQTSSSTGSIELFTSSDGSTWTKKGTVSSAADGSLGSPVSIPSTDNIGFVKFAYDRASGATENYITSVSIVYNCIA